MLRIVNGKEDCPDTLKALWAANLFGVTLYQGGTLSTSEKVALIGDELPTIWDGNVMAQSMDTGGLLFLQGAVVDEWCEWERNVLRIAKNEKQVAPCLARLEKALETSSPLHLVGHTTTVADICVVVTLSTMVVVNPPPPIVKTYLESHQASLAQAKASLSELPTPGLDTSNPSLLRVLESVFSATLRRVFGENVEMPKNNWLGRSSVPKKGDYQITAAMPLFAALKKTGSLPPGMKSPQDVAKAVVEAVGESHPVVQDLSVNGPGFILCRVTPAFLQNHANRLLREGRLPKPPTTEPSVCLVDFSSPNIAKEMHVGHLRSTIIGESVCRILEFVGHKVHRVNHVGDWGTQFGMLIQYLKEEFPDFRKDPPNITDLTLFYKNAKQRFDESPEFKKIAQLNVVKLQSGDAECRNIWTILCDISRREFQKVYDRLDITVEEFGESFYNDKIPPVIDEFDKAGLIRIEEGGAKCVFIEKFPIPLMLQKSDGGYGYDSTDMAAIKYRTHTLGAKRVIVITDFSQADHFKMCNTAASMVGWITDQKLEHIGFGTVMGEDGKRFKTRSGDTVRLVDLLDEAVARMDASLRQRIKDKKANITEEEVPKVAEAIGYSAVKYFDLRRNPTSNYKFSYDQMLDTKGNTAVYLLYAHARLESIMSKAKTDFGVNVEKLTCKIVIVHPSERNVALHLQMFTDMILLTLEDLFPYHVCEYLYNLSIAASDFCTQCKVLGSPEMESRLLLCRATTLAMRECFELVGIRHVQRI